MADAAVVRLLVFRVGSLACAAPADAVREILPRLETVRIPGAPPVVAGVVNVRGTLVTVVEGWRALGLAAPPAAAAAAGAGEEKDGGGGTIVLLQVGPARKMIGFIVDEVLDMLAASEDALEPREALPGLDPRLVRAVGRRAGQPFVVLDTDALLGPILST
jgi:purine-binding chemotaxis protein CheW